jgi:hypothetical protein
MFWTLSTRPNLKFCLPNFLFQFHTRLVWSLLVSMGPTRVVGTVTWSSPEPSCSQDWIAYRQLMLSSFIYFLKRKGVQQPKCEVFRILTIIFKYAKCSNKFQRYFVFGCRFNFLKFWQIILTNFSHTRLGLLTWSSLKSSWAGTEFYNSNKSCEDILNHITFTSSAP